MSKAFEHIAGAFGFATAPFAVKYDNRERAAAYLTNALRAGVRWPEAENDVRQYLASKRVDSESIQREIDRARPLLKPWLE